MFLILVLLGIFSWLGYYTHHGQKIKLPDYVNEPIGNASKDANERTFEIIVNDSVHIVGKKGGLIQNQNPPGGAEVKEKRKIYVTITKHKADRISLSDMSFYGEDYVQVQAQLKRKSISSNVKSYEFDRLTQNSVLEVWHQGALVIGRNKDSKDLVVDKGDTLEFVVSSAQGGSSEVPDLIGRTVEQARFILNRTGLELEITYLNDLGIDDEERAVIAEQDPQEFTSLPRGSAIIVKIKAP